MGQITPAEVYSRLIQQGVNPQEAKGLVQQMQAEDNPDLERQFGEQFQQADENSKVTNQPAVKQNGAENLRNLDSIFPLEADQVDEQGKKQIAEMKDLLKKLNQVSDDPIGDLRANPAIDNQIAEILSNATNGGQNFGDVNLDQFIRDLKKTKLMEIQNKDWVNYLAANNAAIKGSEKLAASAR